MPDFVKASEDTKRKTLVIAATLTSVCLAFPTICAVAAGYKLYAVIDACGNWSKMATDMTIARVVQAGAIPIDTVAVISELQQTWNRPDAMEIANLYADYAMPNYRLLIESYERQIREEYAWVEKPVFAAKRVEILRRFLARVRIYQTDIFYHGMEAQARANLEASVQRLSDGLPS